MRFFQCILVLAVAASDAFSITPSAPRVPMAMDASAQPQLMMSAEQQERSLYDEVMRKYVLLRDEDYTERTPANWWDARVPGTARTILFSSLFCLLVSLPYILTQPAVMVKLVELATLDVVGETPIQVFKETGSFIP